MDNVEDIIRPNFVLHSVHEEDDSTFKEEVEDDGVVDHSELGECQQVSSQPESLIERNLSLPATNISLRPILETEASHKFSHSGYFKAMSKQKNTFL